MGHKSPKSVCGGDQRLPGARGAAGSPGLFRMRPISGERCTRGKRVSILWRGSVSCAHPLPNRGRVGDWDCGRSKEMTAYIEERARNSAQ